MKLPLRIIKTLLAICIFVAASAISAYLTINLLIKSEDTVVVPALTGTDVVYALEVLSELGLDIKVKGSTYSASVPKNHVISQDPGAGSEIKKGRDVRLILSKGARSVILPNLSGLGLPQARIFLKENDLRQGHLSYVYDDVTPPEQVIGQYPPPGAKGLRDETVDLLISSGPSPNFIEMPDLRSMHLNQAIEQIEKYSLTSGAIQVIRRPSIPEEVVVALNPQPGYPVTPGSVVALTINQIRQDRPHKQRNGALLFRHRAPQGYLKQHIRVSMNRASGTMELYNGYVRPGKEVWLLIPENETSTLFLYLDGELAKTIHTD